MPTTLLSPASPVSFSGTTVTEFARLSLAPDTYTFSASINVAAGAGIDVRLFNVSTGTVISTDSFAGTTSGFADLTLTTLILGSSAVVAFQVIGQDALTGGEWRTLTINSTLAITSIPSSSVAVASMRIEVAGGSAAVDGESRTDGTDGSQVTVTSLTTGSTYSLRIVNTTDPTPPTVTVDGSNPAIWRFTPTSGANTYVLELIVDQGLSTEARVRRIYAIRSPNSGNRYPGPMETARSDASLFNNGTQVVLASNDNEGGNYLGWEPSLNEWLQSVDSLHRGVDLPASIDAAAAYTLSDNGNNFLNYDNRIGTRRLSLGNAAENPDFSFLGDGTVTITGQASTSALTLRERAADPGTAVDEGKIYTKDVLGVEELFFQDGARVIQITSGAGVNTSASGEANTASNIGGGAELFSSKVGVDLEFRTFVGTSSVTVSQTANTVLFSTSLQRAYSGGNSISLAAATPVEITANSASDDAIDIVTGRLAMPSTILIGDSTSGTGANSVVIGDNADGSTLLETVTIGRNTASLRDGGAGNNFSVTVGGASTSYGWQNTLVGGNSTVGASGSPISGAVAIGYASNVTVTGGVAVGNNTQAVRSTAVGFNAVASAAQSIAMGDSPDATATGAVAIGRIAQATSTRAVAVGDAASASGADSTAFGTGATAAFDRSIALGRGSTTTAPQQMVVGSDGANFRITEVVIGDGAASTSPGAQLVVRSTDAAAASGASGTRILLRGGRGDGAGADGEVQIDSSLLQLLTTSSSTSFTAAPGQTYILTASSARTVTLPDSPPNSTRITVKEASGTSNQVELLCSGTDQFEDGSTAFVTTSEYAAYTFLYASGVWYVL